MEFKPKAALIGAALIAALHGPLFAQNDPEPDPCLSVKTAGEWEERVRFYDWGGTKYLHTGYYHLSSKWGFGIELSPGQQPEFTGLELNDVLKTADVYARVKELPKRNVGGVQLIDEYEYEGELVVMIDDLTSSRRWTARGKLLDKRALDRFLKFEPEASSDSANALMRNLRDGEGNEFQLTINFIRPGPTILKLVETRLNNTGLADLRRESRATLAKLAARCPTAK